MGWNRVEHAGDLRLFDGIPSGTHFYFVHSYYPVVAGAVSTALTEGGLRQERVAPDARTGRFGRAIRGSAYPIDRCGRAIWRFASRLCGLAWCEYGVRFAAAIETGRIYATQFHPEKSQRWGLRLLENFAAIVKERPVIVIPAIDLRERPVRPPAPGPERPRDRVLRRSARGGERSGRSSAPSGCTSSTSTAPSPASRARARSSRKIVAAVAPVPVEVGGGLRDLAAVEAALETGARWAVVGTRAALDRAFLRDVCRRHAEPDHRRRRRARRARGRQGLDRGGRRHGCRGRRAGA